MSNNVHVQSRIIDNSRVSRPLDTLCGLEYISLTLLGAVFVFGALFYGWQQYQWIQYGYGIEDAQNRIEELSEMNGQLVAEREYLANPERIDQAARAMGMVSPGPEQFVSIDPGVVPVVEPSTTEENPTQLAQRTDN